MILISTKIEKKVNGFYIPEKNHGVSIGLQSSNNKKTIVYIYDKERCQHIAKYVNVLENGEFDI
jgi:hypothetical protein